MFKDELLEAIAGTNRGLLASNTDKQAILSAITQVEDRNPTPRPLEAVELLDGNWRLLYTTSTELLGIDRFPILKLGQIYQCLRIQERKVVNIAEIYGVPFLEGIVSVAASFTPVSEKRVEVKFERFVSGLQKAIGYTSPNQFINELESDKKFLALDFKIAPRDRLGWLDVTYLDRDLRIGRGNEGSVFVLTKVVDG
ncbi:PAP/fibrillin family protein [Merismopedia glauca]|uniref:Fibrillin n=1 Tax=Merismopedia glauca CCAP 1448/3 TaxID=1296344 RepID=A0A2T1C184_9CYAN|nr:PAP/fibrillin family protein [Merismopedia glauca]PSB01938.1 fibrillin [Merismopedia glauca CCAP 1448/3]